ncbi:MAG: integral rane protein MviN [Candidatus Saccharibacteria bacterium]|nr:integral rane protein MviN [Candidatus Saccharibacteria bacterium]
MSNTSTDKKSKRISIGNVAGLLVATALIGQLLGFLRTKLINANFDNPHTPLGERAGVYFAAFNIPDFFFYTIAAGALGVAVMPYLADRLHKGDKRGMWELSTSILNLLAMIMLFVGIIIILFAQPLIELVAPGLNAEQQHNGATLMRWLALNPFLFTVSGILTSAQQTIGRFFFFAIAPLFYNISIIISIYIFKDTSVGIIGLGIGALIGGILQLLVVSAGLIGTNFHWKPKIVWKSEDFRSMLRQLPPRSLDQGADQVQSMVDTRFASVIGGATGISNYNNAYVLHTAPILLLGTAISTAAFPGLNQRLSQGRNDLFRKDFLKTLRVIIWLTIPVVIIAFYARGYLARFIFSQNAPEIATIFGFLTVAIFFRTIYSIISRWFYAQKDTVTPLIVSIFVILLNIILAYLLSRPSSYGIAGLAIAQSLVATIEVLILSGVMVARDHKLLDLRFWTGIAKIVSVAGFSLVAGFIMISIYPLGIDDRGFAVATKLTFISMVVLSVHVGVSALFGLEEVRPVFKRIKTILFKSIGIPY